MAGEVAFLAFQHPFMINNLVKSVVVSEEYVSLTYKTWLLMKRAEIIFWMSDKL